MDSLKRKLAVATVVAGCGAARAQASRGLPRRTTSRAFVPEDAARWAAQTARDGTGPRLD